MPGRRRQSSYSHYDDFEIRLKIQRAAKDVTDNAWPVLFLGGDSPSQKQGEDALAIGGAPNDLK